MVCLALTIPLMQTIIHTIWEYFCFQMIEVGHRAHTALKVLLFRKNFKMTNATNKDFSSGEVSHIIMGESNRIWDFVWSLPEYFETPLHLIVSSYIVFQQIGWWGLISLVFTALMVFKDYVRGKLEKDINEKRGEKGRKRHQLINESFNNIKTVKLYGWEKKFQKSIHDIFEEEMAIADTVEVRNKLYDVVGGVLHMFMPITVFGFYTYYGNTITMAQMALTTIMLERIRGRINHVRHLFNRYFDTMESMEKLWEFYTAPET